MLVPVARAATIPLPGATTSGLTRPSAVGPRLLNEAIWSLSVLAPTVITFSAAAGLPTVLLPGPSLPAATTTVLPMSTTALQIVLRASVPSLLPLDPRDRLMTSAPFCAAHSTPAITLLMRPLPLSASTLATMIDAPGATPTYLPLLAAPEPAAIEATWVPWPLPSSTDPLPEKSEVKPIRPSKSGWLESIPVSTTQIVTPSPRLFNSCQIWGAPMWGTETSSIVWTSSSNQTCSTSSSSASSSSRAGSAFNATAGMI